MTQAAFDRRAATVRHLDLHYPLPHFTSLAAWNTRAQTLREHILACSGLLPAPERTPLRPRFLGVIEGDDYTIEKVVLETLPGFFLGGNLYRPKGKQGPFPGIANPHGHWIHGRIEHIERGSIPARCISFARMGCVSFAYDMIGYNDTRQLSHSFGGDREALWGLSLGGLQLWNSIRALDFLEELPDVDPSRLGCTGASGGGTQTFLLTAVDPRVRVAAPVNMISAHMQGGCLCENIPNLRVDTNNVEIAALIAPRPLLMVAATGDWTKNTPREEFPAVQSIYQLYGAADNIAYVQFDAEHNYNQKSREAVYAWFGRWFLDMPPAKSLPEPPVALEDPQALRVFSGNEQPDGALDENALTTAWIGRSEAQLAASWPRDRISMRRFREQYLPLLQDALGATLPSTAQVSVAAREEPQGGEGIRRTPLLLSREGQGDRVPALLLTPTAQKRRQPGVLLLHPEGIRAALAMEDDTITRLLTQGNAVLLIDAFLTGDSTAPESRAAELAKIKYPGTYNRTDTANRVQDVLTALAFLRSLPEVSAVRLCGTGIAGLWGLLACALDGQVEAAALDLAQFNVDADESFLAGLHVPCLRRAGDVRAAAALCAPTRLLLHNAHASFPAEKVAAAYQSVDMPDQLRVVAGTAEADTVFEFLSATI